MQQSRERVAEIEYVKAHWLYGCAERQKHATVSLWSASTYFFNLWMGLWICEDEWWNNNVGPSPKEKGVSEDAETQRRYCMCVEITGVQRRLPSYDFSEWWEMWACVSVMGPICSMISTKTDTTVQWRSVCCWSLTSKCFCNFIRCQCKKRCGTTTTFYLTPYTTSGVSFQALYGVLNAKRWTGWPIQVDWSAKANSFLFLQHFNLSPHSYII